MTHEIDGLRRYGCWGGCPNGTPEDPTRCIEEVYPRGGGWIPYQCSRKRGHGPDGLYCKLHAKNHEPPDDRPMMQSLAKT